MRKTMMWGLALLLTLSLPVWAQYPEASEVLAEMEFGQGLFQTYTSEQELYLGVGDDMLDVPFLIATTVTSGGEVTGYQWNDYLVCFEKIGDQIVLVEKNTSYLSDGVLEDAVSRTHTDRVLFAFPIEAMNSDWGTYVIDAGMLFANNCDVLFGGGFVFDASLARLSLKPFADNLEISFTMPNAYDGQLMTVHYSVSRLSDNDYTPRHADPRVGYFLTAQKDLSNGSYEEGQFVRLINRWNVQKLDPSLDVSPPAEPIIFYIEKTVPVRFRQAVAEGILEWNKAFEAIGIVGAIVVRQQTDYNEFADLDPADVNYNFFRWITSGSAFAMGPSRVNPLTGEILDADIIFDDSMANSYESEGAFYFGDEAMGPQWSAFLDSFGENHVLQLFRNPETELTVAGQPVDRHSDQLCSLGKGRTHQLGMARLALGDGVRASQFINAVVKDTVMHEVGHTLGLRHNFKASTWRSLAEINSEDAPQAIAGSVMDYIPVNIAGEGAQGAYAMGTLGPYDFWAIEYGYKAVDDPSELETVLQRVAEEGLAYGTDEDTMTPDPEAVRWDLGDDMVAYAESRMNLATSMWNDVLDRVVEDGESYTKATPAFRRLFFEYWYAVQLAGRYVGGTYLHRDFKGDPNGRAPVVPVEAERQRRALDLAVRVLEGRDFNFPPELLRHLAAGRWSHWGSMDWLADTTFPIRDTVLAAQLRCYGAVLNPSTLDELLGQSYLSDEENPVTAEEVVDTLFDAVFGEFLLDAQVSKLSDMRRNLQRSVSEHLIGMLLDGSSGWYPPEVRATVRMKLKTLVKSLNVTSDDLPTQVHVADLEDRIQRALSAEFSQN